MALQFSKEQIQQARRTDLTAYLLAKHPDVLKRDGRIYFRFKNNPSISIRTESCAYKDYATGEKGNSVDFLVRHMGYSVPEAVYALTDSGFQVVQSDSPYDGGGSEQPDRDMFIPEKADSYKRMFAFLTKTRGIKPEIVQKLIDKKLLYQEKAHNNAVFISIDKDFCELHGTLSYGDSFHQCRKVNADRCWYFTMGEKNPDKVYVCEAAIDAISLYQLKMDDNAAYVSIGGVENKKAISRLNTLGIPVILAVDNDDAGQRCRDEHPDYEFILPKNKDWNEDLTKGVTYE